MRIKSGLSQVGLPTSSYADVNLLNYATQYSRNLRMVQ